MSEDVLAGVGVYTPAMGPGSPGAGMSLREIDPDTVGTGAEVTLFDYNDHAGTRNPGGVWTYLGLGGVFGLNAPNVSIDTSDRNDDGVPDTTFSYDEIVQSSFRFRAAASSYANLRTGIGVLQRLLSKDGVLRWVPNGDANGDPFTPGEIYYIYRKPSNIPALFSGGDIQLYTRTKLFDSPDGVEVVINRERLLRGPTLLASVNKLANSTLLRFSGGSSTTPDSWAWDSTTNLTFASYGANVSWANQSYRFVIATTGTRNLQQSTGSGSAAPGDVWTFPFYVKAAGGTLAKAQAVLEFMSAANAVLATATGTLTTLVNSADFVRLSVTSSAAPASTDHVRVNVRLTNGDATSYTVDLRNAQLEKAAAVSTFRVGAETVANKITGAPGKAMFSYNAGDADALVRLTATPSSNAQAVALLAVRKAESTTMNLA